MYSRQVTLIEELIMIAMRHNPRYGLEIINLVYEASDGGIDINLGALYPALKRLQRQNLIKTVDKSENPSVRNGHSRKYYELTEDGYQVLNEINAVRVQLVERFQETETKLS